MEFYTEYPVFLIVVCIGFAATCAFFLYYHRERYLNDAVPLLKRVLFGLRFFALLILSFFLLGPVLKLITTHIQKPVVILAQDNSYSLVLNKDSTFYKTRYPASFQKLKDALSESYDVKTVLLGQHVREAGSIDFKDKQSNISEVFSTLVNQYTNENLGAVVLASDGIFNAGSNPLYEAESIKSPVYTIAMGDTTVRKDLSIARLNYNRTGFLGNVIPIEAILSAHKCKGENIVITLSENNEILQTKPFLIGSNSWSQPVNFTITPKSKGFHQYHLSVTHLSVETSVDNNQKDLFIEILENKQKILCLYAAPHPDQSAIKQLIEKTDNYEIKFIQESDFKDNINEYQLLILYQVPSVRSSPSLLASVRNSKVPLLFVLGGQTDVKNFNLLNAGFAVEGYNGRTSEALPIWNTNFSLFTLSSASADFIAKYPPLVCPFGVYKSTGSGNVILQQVNHTETNQPLVSLTEEGETRKGVIAGEGFWRWRLYDYLNNSVFEHFDEFFLKIIQFLSTKEEKKHLKILAKTDYTEADNINLEAVVLNEVYEMVNNSDVKLEIINKNAKKSEYLFSRNENKAYQLNIGSLPPGSYEYSASTSLGSKSYADKGRFSVLPLQVESTETTADHQLLYSLASTHNGKMFYPDQLDKLAKELMDRQDIKPVSFSDTFVKDLINLKWLLALILLLLFAEWFLRKSNGAF